MGTTPPLATQGATLSASWSDTDTTPTVTTRGAPSLGALAATEADETFKAVAESVLGGRTGRAVGLCIKAAPEGHGWHGQDGAACAEQNKRNKRLE
jgi:hypothetical protein